MASPSNLPPVSGPLASKFYFGLDNVQHNDLVRFGKLPDKAAEWPDGQEKPTSHTKFTNTFLEHYLPTIFPHLETHDIFILISPLGYEIPIDRNTGYPLMVEKEDMRIWIQEQEEAAKHHDDFQNDDFQNNDQEESNENDQESNPDMNLDMNLDISHQNSEDTVDLTSTPSPASPDKSTQDPVLSKSVEFEPADTAHPTSSDTQNPPDTPDQADKTAISVYPKIAPLRRVLHRIDMKTVPKHTQRIHVNAVGYWNYQKQYVDPRNGL